MPINITDTPRLRVVSLSREGHMHESKGKEECCRYYGVIGFLNIRQATEFLGGRSVSWVRSHLHEIPYRKLYDRLLFDPQELRAYV